MAYQLDHNSMWILHYKDQANEQRYKYKQIDIRSRSHLPEYNLNSST